MPLYPNTPFIEGQEVTPDLFYQAFNPVFDDQTQYLGHLARLTDDSLSGLPGQLKDRVSSITNNFRVSTVTGLAVSYTGGSLINNNDLITLAPGTLSIPASGSYYIFIDRSNNVRVSATLPAVRIMLAYAITNAAAVVSLFDLRTGAGYPTLTPNLSSIATFGGQGEDGDYNAVNGDILREGDYSFTSFNVPTGVAITVSQFAKIRVTGNVTIAGTVTVTVNVLATGGIYILRSNTMITGTPNRGLGSRGGEFPADPYSPAQQPYGSDGCNATLIGFGDTSGSISGFAAPGGTGGGGLLFDCAGVFTLAASGVITARGIRGGNAFQGQNDTLNTTLSGAAGGGSGGFISIKSPNLAIIAGRLDVSGNNGGDGLTTPTPVLGLPGGTTWAAEGGCGGGGGYIQIQAPVVNNTGMIAAIEGGAAGVGNPTTGTNRLVLFNSPGGSFGGMGGSASSVTGTPGASGVIRIKTSLPSPS